MYDTVYVDIVLSIRTAGFNPVFWKKTRVRVSPVFWKKINVVSSTLSLLTRERELNSSSRHGIVNVHGYF